MKKTKTAKVHVDESQAPLAIGKNGINVNLASRLTEYEIDIVQTAASVATETTPETTPPAETDKPAS
jgi:transcription antitermination factor NusA-like protein